MPEMKKKKPTNLLILCFLSIFIASCAGVEEENFESRGYVTKFSDFSKVKLGESDKEEVLNILGSPITTSIFGDEQWVYAGGEVTKETFFKPELKTYESFVITFDKNGIVKKIDKKDKSALRDVKISKDETSTSGNSVTLIQQLLGNVGKFNSQNKVGAGGGLGR